MVAGNGVKFSLTPVRRSTGTLDVCPFLRLARDPNTSALYPRPDHRCIHLGKEPLSVGWQRTYCLADGHRTCPYFLGEGAVPGRSRGRAAAGHIARRLLPFAVIALAVLLVLVLLGLATDGAAGFDIRDRLRASPDVERRVRVARSGSAPPESQSPKPGPGARAERSTSAGRLATGLDGAERFADDEFRALWMRTDAPISGLGIERSGVWGSGPISGAIHEEWTDAPDGERLVQYFPKGRMERLTTASSAEPGSVSSGLLVSEMIGGYVQTGPDVRVVDADPPDVPIVGDPATTGLPSYAEINEMGLIERDTRHTTGDPISETLVNGVVERSFGLGDREVTAADIAAETDHAVASVFQDYFDEGGTIHEDNAYTSGDLFEDPTQLFGLPITEAYWARSERDGERVDLLWQCFERRCLTYVPENDPGRRIESGDAGSHYYAWRYGEGD